MKIYVATIGFCLCFFILCCSFSAKAQPPVINSFSPTSAARNFTVTITGSNLAEVTAVSFGGVPSPEISVINDNTIRARVGVGASGSISVSGVTGSASQTGFTFLPSPVVTSFSPTTAGKDTVVTIRGRHFNNMSGVRFGNVSAASYTVTSDTTIRAVVGDGASGSVLARSFIGTSSLGGFVHTGPVVRSFSPTIGVGGTAIAIIGKNLSSANAVTIGGVPVTAFTVLSDTAISAVVPANALGTVKVTSPYGASSVQAFNQCHIRFFSPNEGTTGTVVKIEGINFTNASAVSFGAMPAASFTVISDTVIMATVGANDSYGAVKVTTPLYGTAETASGNYFFYYQGLPTFLSFSPKVGGPGTVISLKGRNFTGTTSVTFSEYAIPAASFTVVSDTLIEAVVGNGASGDIRLENATINPNITISQSGFVFTTLPLINSVSPQRGPAGSVVKISGINFGTNQKTVYIGGVKAPVIASNNFSVTAILPPNAGTQPITVTRTDSLTATWYRHFAITYPGDTSISPNSFSLQSILVTRGNFITGMTISDFDADGRKDIAVNVEVDGLPDTLIVYRNTSSNGILTFAPPVTVSLISTHGQLYNADFDGDGRLDLAATGPYGVFVYKNTSTAGSISFAPVIGFGTFTLSNYGINGLAIGDFDTDGKPDIAVPSYFGHISLLRNTTVNGNISFIEPFTDSPLLMGSSKLNIVVADLNKDNRPEIVANKGTALYVLRNTSPNVGKFSFATKNFVLPATGDPFSYVDIGDLNGDATPDIVASTYDPNNFASRVHVLKNVSSGTVVSLTPDTTLNAPVNPGYISVADVNGDNKPEVLTSTGHVWNNGSSNGNIRLGPVASSGNRGNGNVFVADLDGDSKPEMIQLPFFSDTVFILKNKVQPNLLHLCPPVGSTIIATGLPGGSGGYQWQVDRGAGFANIADTGYYTGTATGVLQITNLPTLSYGYKYRCIVNGSTVSDATEIRFRNIWVGTAGSAWENPANWSCGTVPDAKTDVVINVGTVVVNSNVTIKSLVIDPSVSLTVNSGNTLTISQ